MRRFHVSRVPRLLVPALAFAVAMLGFGLGATPASALNHDTYNILRNADLHQYCLDIRAQDQRDGARAQLWTCTHPVVGEQLFKLVSDNFGADHIRIKRSGYCLEPGFPAFQAVCDLGEFRQTWILKDTGEIMNGFNGLCLVPLQRDTKGAFVGTLPCDGSIEQRWFF